MFFVERMAECVDEYYGATLTDEEVTNEMRGQAYRICRDYLHGAWKMIGSEDMVIKHISGGLSNHLYYCALPSSVTPAANEPSEVLVRFYGQVHGEGALESLLAESVIFTLLSERRLGPRLYGVFPGGRLEQYIPARSLTTAELANPQISREVASKMAKMHAMNVPISKEPTWMWNCMKRWLKSSDEFLRTSSAPSNIDPTSKRHSMLEKLRQVDFEEEMNFMKRIVTKIQSPVVFAHNDMQEGNILFNNNALRFSDKISLIDFEYCSYNHRGFDVANHFCEWVYSYKLQEEPYFTHDIKAFPNKNQQLNFIRAYLTAYEAACGRKISQTSESNGLNNGKNLVSSSESRTKTPCASHSENTSDNNDTEKETQLSVSHPAEEKLLQEVQVFTLTSHLFWTLWSIVQGHVSEIPFGYLEYGLVRLNHYNECKRLLKCEEFVKRKSDHITTKD